MTAAEMYEIEAKVIEIGYAVGVAEYLLSLSNVREIVEEVISNSGKYGDTLLISCEMVQAYLKDIET